jgi:CRP-like cAMP-binding protein
MKLDSSAFLADPELIEALGIRSVPITCGADRILFHQGEAPQGLYILQQGEVTLTMDSASGATIISSRATSGSLLGLPGLIGNEPYTLTAVAHNGARLGFVSRDEFTGLMQTNPLLSLKVLQVLAAEVRSARHVILDR